MGEGIFASIMNRVPKSINLISVLGFVVSLAIVAVGQPARLGGVGAVVALLGFALFFCTLPLSFKKVHRFFSGVIWFAAVQLIQLSWMTSIEFQGYYVLIVYGLLVVCLACQFGLLTGLIPSNGKIPWPKLLFCAAFWTLMEWIRLFVLCGFSWNPIGLALTHFTCSLQMSSLFGVLGLSFWVMATNLWMVNVWRARFKVSHLLLWLGFAIFPYIFGAIHCKAHLLQSRAQQQLSVALVQTALLPTQKIPHLDHLSDFISPLEQWKRIIKSLKETQMPRWDLIILPEAAVPLLSDLNFYPYETIRELFISEFGQDIILKFPPLTYPYSDERDYLGRDVWCVSNLFFCQVLANHYQAEMITGLDYSDPNGKNFNSAFYLTPHGWISERYDKQILLPLAEYLPFDFLRPLAKWYGIHDFFSRGNGAKIFGRKIPFSVAICYEETFSEIMREGRKKGAGLFITITNDNYYPNSSLHEQHFTHARLRAVENGIPLLRACNSGVTAAVSSLGETIGRFGEGLPFFQNQEGTLSCRVPIYRYATLFSFWGDAGIISICFLILCAYVRLKSRQF